MNSGPICAMVWEGRDAVKTGRGKFDGTTSTDNNLTYYPLVLLGATNPLASAPGTIRGDFASMSSNPSLRDISNLFLVDVGRNVCHGSDSVENAKKEIALWFKEGEVLSWKSAQNDWIYEKA